MNYKTKIKIKKNHELKAVVIYNPKINSKDWAILDVKSGLILGLNDNRPYYPYSVDFVIDSGFVAGCWLYGFECWNCHDLTYRLGVKPEMLPI